MSTIFQKDPVSLSRYRHKIHFRTQIIFTGPAHFTTAATFARFHGNPVTNLQIPDISADFYNGSAAFVPQHQRFIHNPVSYTSRFEEMYIRSADPNIFNLYQHFIWLNLWYIALFHLHFADSRHHRNFHFSIHFSTSSLTLLRISPHIMLSTAYPHCPV